MKVALNLLLILIASALCLLAVEGLTRVVLDDGMLYELEMWKYARGVKERDMRPDFGHRHRPNAEAQLMGVHVRTNKQGLGVGAVAMAEIGPHVAFLHPARVLPHFELVQHAVVENDAGQAFHSEQTQSRSDQDQQKI